MRTAGFVTAFYFDKNELVLLLDDHGITLHSKIGI